MEFGTTRWSIIANAKDGDSRASHKALDELCQIYWFPLYSFFRGKGCKREEAEDLTQEFFARFLQKDGIKKVERDRGKFRSFMLKSAKNFMVDEWKKGRAKKRGGGSPHLSLDFPRAEQLVGGTIDTGMTAEEIYDYHWAKTIIANALQRVKTNYENSGKDELFGTLRPLLDDSEAVGSYADIGATLGMSEGAVKVAVHRLRKRYREALESEVSETLVVGGDLRKELGYLIDCVSG